MKKLSVIALLLILIVALTACNGGGDSTGGAAQVRYPVGLSASESDIQLELGKPAYIIVYMEDATPNASNSYLDGKLIYESSNSHVTIERNHEVIPENHLEAHFIVSASSVGEATLTIRTPFTDVSCSVNVTVVEPDPISKTLSMGENSFDGFAITTYTYTAPDNGKLKVVGTSGDYGFVSYSYTINGEPATSLESDTEIDIDLNSGDVIEITIEGNGPSVLLATWHPTTEDPNEPGEPGGDSGETDIPEGNYSLGLSYALSDDGTYYIVTGRGTCTDTDIIIAPTYKGLPVKEIGEEAFYVKADDSDHNTDITVSVTIPSSVEFIGAKAFYYSSTLTTVIIEVENGIFPTEGTNAFFLCQPDVYAYRALDSVIYIGDFETLNTNVAWPAICTYAADMINVNVTFDGTIGTIEGVYACKNLIVTGGVDTVKTGAFSGNSNGGSVQTINFNGVKTIEAKAFYQNKSIRSFNFEGLTSLGKSAFEESTLTSATIPGTLIAIPERAFYDADLGRLTIEDGVISIGASAFYWCNLGYVNFGNTLTSIDQNAFTESGISGTLTIPASVTYIGSGAFSYNQGISNVVMLAPTNDKVRSVGSSAFARCDYMTAFSADGLTDYGAQVFEGCYRLESIDFGIINSINTSALAGLWNYRNQFKSITYDNTAENTKCFKVGNTSGKKLPTSIVDLLSLLSNETSTTVYQRVAPDEA